MFDMNKEWRWDIPFDRANPILFPKDCQLLSPDREHYDEVYELTSDLTAEEKANPYAKYYYVTESGLFRIHVGGSSRDCLTCEVTVNF